METVNCNYCNAENSVHIFTLPDSLLEREDILTDFVRCQTCGLIYQNPRPSLDEMQEHYPPEYDSYPEDLTDKKIPWLLRKAYAYGVTKRVRVVTRRKKSGKLLDIGCATGTFLLGMKKQAGWETMGIEISPHAAAIARKHHLDVFTGTLEDANFPAAEFDAVTLWDVLEHLHDPAGSLREIHRVLKPGGVIVIRVPNVASWDASWFGAAWAGWDAPRHLYVFSPNTLEKMLAASGFQVEDINCSIGSYPTFVLSVRFWLYRKGVAPEKRDKIIKFLYHPFSRILSAPLFYLLGLQARGPLITVTAVKKVN